MARTILAAFLATGALAACAGDAYDYNPADGATGGAPAVGSSSDLSAFEGARAGQAEMGITSLGYAPARSEGLTTWWYNAETGACARIVTSDGRYSSVDMVSASDC